MQLIKPSLWIKGHDLLPVYFKQNPFYNPKYKLCAPTINCPQLNVIILINHNFAQFVCARAKTPNCAK